MRAAGLDALAVYTNNTRPAGVSWLCGFVPYWSEAMLVLPRDGEPRLVAALSKRVTVLDRGDEPHRRGGERGAHRRRGRTDRGGAAAARSASPISMRCPPASPPTCASAGATTGRCDGAVRAAARAGRSGRGGARRACRRDRARGAGAGIDARPPTPTPRSPRSRKPRARRAQRNATSPSRPISRADTAPAAARRQGAARRALRDPRHRRLQGRLGARRRGPCVATRHEAPLALRAAERLAAAVAALPDAQRLRRHRVLAGRGLPRGAAARAAVGIAAGRAAPDPGAASLVSVQACLDIDGGPVVLGAPALLGGAGEAAGFLVPPIYA